MNIYISRLGNKLLRIKFKIHLEIIVKLIKIQYYKIISIKQIKVNFLKLTIINFYKLRC